MFINRLRLEYIRRLMATTKVATPRGVQPFSNAQTILIRCWKDDTKFDQSTLRLNPRNHLLTGIHSSVDGHHKGGHTEGRTAVEYLPSGITASKKRTLIAVCFAIHQPTEMQEKSDINKSKLQQSPPLDNAKKSRTEGHCPCPPPTFGASVVEEFQITGQLPLLTIELLFG
ncbi:hypothetical protein TYRP_020947 [Tyrophagus putrescentiae]|nr:hypothetical protein TYRP_020947 [Tyrophagus putrescentiae]